MSDVDDPSGGTALGRARIMVVRLTQRERELFRAAATKEGVTLSAFVRACVYRHLEEQGAGAALTGVKLERIIMALQQIMLEV